VVKNIPLVLLLCLLATLPFPKGKAYQILLLPREDIPRWALYNISYFFPIYISDLFLGLLLYWYIRTRSVGRQIVLQIYEKMVYVLFLVFIAFVFFSGSLSQFPEVGVLSAAQLVRMFLLMSLPFLFTQNIRGRIQEIVSVVAATTLFESWWVFLQRLSGGPLWRDIEVYLPGSAFGIRSSENVDVLRLSGTFFEPSILGTFLLMHIVILGVWLARARLPLRPLDKVLSIVSLLAGIALMFTGSRMIYAIFGLWLVWFVHQWKQGRIWMRLFLRTRQFVYVCLMLLLSVVPYVTMRLQSITDVFTQYGSASYRLQMMEYATRLAWSHPFFGVGLSLSPYYLATGFWGERFVFDPTYPHNLFFQLLSEVGFVGAAWFFIFVLVALRYTLSSSKTEADMNLFGYGAFIYIVCACFYPIFINHQEISSYFFIYIGLALFFKSND
jgi:O-antigen ligase